MGQKVMVGLGPAGKAPPPPPKENVAHSQSGFETLIEVWVAVVSQIFELLAQLKMI